LEIGFRRRPKVGRQSRRKVRHTARAAGSTISLAEVTDKWREPQVSYSGQPKDNIRSNPEVTPRAVLVNVTCWSNPAGDGKRDDWTCSKRRKPKAVRPASLKDTGTGASG